MNLKVYDYGFSPHRGEGFKIAIHHHMDQPIMALSDVDISPGFVTQLSVTPTLTITTDEARNRFTPNQRVCYFDDEFRFKYLPSELYRYVSDMYVLGISTACTQLLPVVIVFFPKVTCQLFFDDWHHSFKKMCGYKTGAVINQAGLIIA